jgi:hypothetical protein
MQTYQEEKNSFREFEVSGVNSECRIPCKQSADQMSATYGPTVGKYPSRSEVAALMIASSEKGFSNVFVGAYATQTCEMAIHRASG